MQHSRIKPVLACYMMGMAILNFFVVWQLRGPVVRGYGDFAAFYTAGKLLQKGSSAELYNAASQWQVQQQFAPAVTIRLGPLPYVRPPFQALFFLPFAYLNYQAAFLAWTCIKLLLLLASTFLLTDLSRHKLFSPAFTAALLLGLFPIAIDFLQGQDAILLLFVLAVFYRILAGQQLFRAGCVLALGMFKFHLVLPLALFFLLRRQFRLLYGFALVTFAETAISVALSGWTVLWLYPRYLLGLARNSGSGLITTYDMPNVHALLAGLSGREPSEWILIVIQISAIVLVAWICQKQHAVRMTQLSISLTTVVIIFTSPYAYSHDLVLLVIPVLVLQNAILGDTEIGGWPRILFLLSIGGLALAPLHWFLLLRTSYFYLGATLLLAMAAIGLSWAYTSRATSDACLS